MKGNRWVILIASLFMNICVGSAYAWSVFQKPLINLFGWSTSSTNLAFTISLSTVPIAMIIMGAIADKKGPRIVVLIGSIIFGAGIILAGFTQSIVMLYLTYGLLGGIGIGCVYGTTIANSVKWFPDKRGLASGLVAAGFGIGAIVLAPIAAALIQSFGVLKTFNILGCFYLVGGAIAGTFVYAPPPGYKPEGWTPPVASPAAPTVSSADRSWREMLSDPIFYVLWAMYTFGCVSGLMIIGHASPIGQEMVKLSATASALALSFLAIANTGGRVFCGWLSDKIGRYQSLLLMFVLAALTMFLIGFTRSFTPFVIALMAAGLTFGGWFAIFPSICAEMFGPKNLGMNYGILFTAYGLAAFIGPRLASVIKESSNGDYTLAFVIAGVMSVAGILLTFVAMYRAKRLAAAAAARAAQMGTAA